MKPKLGKHWDNFNIVKMSRPQPLSQHVIFADNIEIQTFIFCNNKEQILLDNCVHSIK